MSTTSPFLCYIATVLVSQVLFQYAGAVLDDRERALLAYNAATDPCTSLNAFSSKKENEAANWACKEAFLALDRIGGNSCSGWRQPGCRFFAETYRRECSCLISECNQMLVISDVEKPFRDCALGLWIDELYAGQGIQETGTSDDSDPLQGARSFRDLLTAGSSGGASASYGTGAPHAHSPGRQQGSSSRHDAMASNTSTGMNPEVEEASDSVSPYVCDICDGVYTSERSYDQHMKTHTTDVAFCKLCNKTYSTPSNYYAHKRVQHGEGKGGKGKGTASKGGGSSEGVTIGAGGKIFKCPAPGCGSEYKSTRALRDHKKSHTEDLRCRLCRRPFKSKSNFHVHIRDVHRGHEAEASGARPSAANPAAVAADDAATPFVCDKCGLRFSKKHTLKQHKKCHEPKSTTCKICSRDCLTVYNFRLHMKTEHKQKPKFTPGEASGHKS